MGDPWMSHHIYSGQQAYMPQGQPQFYYTPTAAVTALPPTQPMWVQAQAPYAPSNPMHIPGTNAARLLNGYQSMKYPELHPTLAIDSSIVKYDVRLPPKEGIAHPTFHGVRTAFALAKPVDSILLISADFPWSILLKGSPRQPVTVEYVWEALYNLLQGSIEDSEWGILCLASGDGKGDRKRRDIIKGAADRRLKDDKKAKDKKLKKIDWLGDATIFKGLERDDDFAKKRAPPGWDEAEETWVVKMST